MKLEFVGDCVGNPFPTVEILSEVIDKAVEITSGTFHRRCDVPEDTRTQLRTFPHDYTYHRSRYRGEWVYFFIWSMIEHFFM